MEQAAAQYWMVMKRKQEMVKKNVSWEERAFGEEHAALIMWPPRSYPCSFCNRDFRSAQALGGHMNVHRRDRARLNQSLETDLSVGLSLSSESESVIMGCKRPKLAVSCSLNPCFQAAAMEDLDLELRLGHDPPQVK